MFEENKDMTYFHIFLRVDLSGHYCCLEIYSPLVADLGNLIFAPNTGFQNRGFTAILSCEFDKIVW